MCIDTGDPWGGYVIAPMMGPSARLAEPSPVMLLVGARAWMVRHYATRSGLRPGLIVAEMVQRWSHARRLSEQSVRDAIPTASVRAAIDKYYPVWAARHPDDVRCRLSVDLVGVDILVSVAEEAVDWWLALKFEDQYGEEE